MTMPNTFSQLTEEQRGQHTYFPAGVDCAYWGEFTPHKYTGGKLADFSPTNRLISNLKKKMDRRDKPDFRYKAQAIVQCAGALIRGFNWEGVAEGRVAFVPIPPSRARGDANYDPRLMDILNLVKRSRSVIDIRDCLSFDGRHVASHETNARPGIDDLYDALYFNLEAARILDVPGEIVLFDDMLTTGAHFVAASRKLAEYFPGVTISGCFLARRVLPDISDVFEVL
jgi:hypothetical protein